MALEIVTSVGQSHDYYNNFFVKENWSSYLPYGWIVRGLTTTISKFCGSIFGKTWTFNRLQPSFPQAPQLQNYFMDDLEETHESVLNYK